MKRLVITGLLMLAACNVATTASAQAIAKGKNELAGDITLFSSQRADAEAERFTSSDVAVAYSRYVTDRLAVGPLFGVTKVSGSDSTSYVGGVGRYHFGDLSKLAVPLVEVRVSRSLSDPIANYDTLQLLAGVQFAMGKTGGRFRITPYYYRAFYDETQSSDYQSFGISWSVALLF